MSYAADSVDEALAFVPEGWALTLDRYIVSDQPEPNARTWRVWLKRLVGDLDGDGPCYTLKAFGTGETPAKAIHAALLDTKRFAKADRS